MTDMNSQVFLSAEEQAALAEPDDDTLAAEAADDAELEAAQDDSDAGQEDYQPLLQVREIPQAGAALRALDDREAGLQTLFDEGDITSGELASGLKEVQKHRSEIEWALKKNDLAETMARDHEDAKWDAAVSSFMKGPAAAIAKNEALTQAFDSIVRKVTADASNVGLSFRQQLEKAHKLFNDDVAKAGFSLDRGFSDDNMASDSANFAALDRLADSNPTRFEREFAKLSADDQAAYLES